jgi:hypothetical protein
MLSVPGGSNISTSQASVVRVNSAARPPRSHRTSARRDAENGEEGAGQTLALSEVEDGEAAGAEQGSLEAVEDAQFAMAIAITTDDIIHHRHVPRRRYPDIHRPSLPLIHISPISLDVFS